MTKVAILARPRVIASVQTLTRASTLPLNLKKCRPTTAAMDAVQSLAAIENALSMALYFVRQPGNTQADLWAATARTNRALTLLKQANAYVGGEA